MTMVRTLTAVVLVAGLLLVGGGVSAREAALSTDTPTGLSEAEALDLQYLRDEEKLARDVYLYFAAIYNKPIFSDIAASEQQHMDAVKTLLDRYNIEDPVAGLAEGEFHEKAHADYYRDLTAAGTPDPGEELLVALEGALWAGATIEDLDILDISEMLARTDKGDLRTVYENLIKGSRNHLRAFCDLLVSLYGHDYKAQFLDQEEVDAILATGRETGKD